MTVKEYLRQRYSYGGVVMMLGEIILDLQKIAPNQRCVDAYVIGLTNHQKPIDDGK